MFIDKTYFDGILQIVNISEPSPNDRTSNVLNELIEQCEEVVLSYAFGRVMYNDFKQNYLTNEFYTDILDGKTYEKDGKKYHWLGLVQKDLKKSLLADYVYSQYHTLNVTQHTDFGQVKVDTKIGTKASSTPKIVRAWNSFLTQLQGGYYKGGHGLTPEGNPYWVVPNRLGNGYGISYYRHAKGGEVSLMQFLSDNKENYPLFIDDNRMLGNEFKNSFGI